MFRTTKPPFKTGEIKTTQKIKRPWFPPDVYCAGEERGMQSEKGNLCDGKEAKASKVCHGAVTKAA